MTSERLVTRWGVVNGEARLHYLPAAHVLISLPESNDRVVIRSLNLQKTLDAEGANYLFVLSVPRRKCRAGGTYDYQIDVRSKAGGVHSQLEAGPEGMTVSPGGRLCWNVPSLHEGSVVNAIVTIRDSSVKEIQHSFLIVVQ